MAWYGEPYPEYVSAAERRLRAQRQRKELIREGIDPRPIAIEGREIAHTFWGKAWCVHIESLADLATRLPRGRSYVRNGAVLHLEIARGTVRARVSGTELYLVEIGIVPLRAARWKAVRRACAGRIATAVELLSGKLSSAVMTVLCDPERGVFPRSEELELSCSCPDGARLCKHLAAVLYGVGARLDEAPELLFTLRGVELEELVAAAGEAGARAGGDAPAAPFTNAELSEIFGIELMERGQTLTLCTSPSAASRRKGRRGRP
jgi:uncharacterized Zn finger protein